jgi:hypothetical protein
MAGQGRKRQLVSLPGTAAIPSVVDARLGYREERSWPIAAVDYSRSQPIVELRVTKYRVLGTGLLPVQQTTI